MLSTPEILPAGTSAHVASQCLCLQSQRAARALARLFDAAFRPLGLTSGQYSLMMALHRPQPPSISELAPFLATDRTSLTAALKPLTRRGLVSVAAAANDRRNKLLSLTPAGERLLAAALPIWRDTHARLDAAMPAAAPERLRADLPSLPPACRSVGSG